MYTYTREEEKEMFRVEVNYGSIVKAYGVWFRTAVEAQTFAQSKEIYPAFISSKVVEVLDKR